MFVNIVIPIISACIGAIVSNLVFLWDDLYKYKRQVLKERYDNLYLPFYKYYLTNDVCSSLTDHNEFSFQNIKGLNSIIFNNFQYLTPKLQTECMILIKTYNVISKFRNYQLIEIASTSEKKIHELSVNFYNSLLKEYCLICKQLKLQVPIYEDILIK